MQEPSLLTGRLLAILAKQVKYLQRHSQLLGARASVRERLAALLLELGHREAGKVLEAAFQLNAFSMVLRAIRKMAFLTDYDETHLRTGLHRLIAALALFVEKIQRQTIKICTGLYVSEDQKKEEIISPFVNEAIKKLTFTNRQTGAKETFTLKESKCWGA